MKWCPFHEGLWRDMRQVWDDTYALSSDIRDNNDSTETTKFYKTLGDIISDIFLPDFFEQSIDCDKFKTIWFRNSYKIFQKIGETKILQYFTAERRKWRILSAMSWTKLYPMSPEEIIIAGWWHACYIVWVLVRHSMKNWIDNDTYRTLSRIEAKRIVMILASMHLNIESAFVTHIDTILSRGYVSSGNIYNTLDTKSWLHLPVLWCPAIFFWDKRIGKSLFTWIQETLEKEYPSREDRDEHWLKQIRDLFTWLLWRLR